MVWLNLQLSLLKIIESGTLQYRSSRFCDGYITYNCNSSNNCKLHRMLIDVGSLQVSIFVPVTYGLISRIQCQSQSSRHLIPRCLFDQGYAFDRQQFTNGRLCQVTRPKISRLGRMGKRMPMLQFFVTRVFLCTSRPYYEMNIASVA